MTCPDVSTKARLVQIGAEVFPVYGDEKTGWSLDLGDLCSQMPKYRYRSFDELFFALVNLKVAPEGQA